MTYGISCVNTSGELTVSSEAFTLGYLGKATLVSVTHYSGITNSSHAGYATWTFSSTGPIICAIGLKTSTYQTGAVIQEVYKTGSSTWTIIVYDQTTTDEGPSGGGSYAVPSSTSDIYVFGLPSSPAPFGAALYNSSGNLTADLTMRPLSPLARISLGTNVMSCTIPSVVKPAIIGYPNSSHVSSSGGHGGSLPWINTWYYGSWNWNGGTTLNRIDALGQYDNDDAGVAESADHGPCQAILIEANGLT